MPARRNLALVSALALALGDVACAQGGQDQSPPTPESSGESHSITSEICPPAPSDLAATLRDGIRGRGELRRLFAVRSRASFSDKDPKVRAGVYFVAGNIGATVVTWAVNVQAWRSGEGLIVAADRHTRAVSPRRWVVSRRLLEERYGIEQRTDGYARARACANPTRA